MFNVTILKMRDIIKYFIGLLTTIIVVIVVSKFFSKDEKNNNENKIVNEVKNGISMLSEQSFLGCFEQAVPVMANVNEEYSKVAKEDDHSREDILQGVLETQISSIKGIEKIENVSNSEEVANAQNVSSEETSQNIQDSIEETQTKIHGVEEAGVKTEVITNNPITESYNVEYGKVKIKNGTDYTLTQEMLTPDITIENKNIVLFHTHSCESYTSSEAYPYTPTGNYRTTDLNFTVTRVGTELETQLKQYNYKVVHNTDYHDYPAYNGSYTRSLKTVQNILQTTSADIIIDVHRDAIGSRSDYAPTVKIGDTDEAAQLMFVIGTNAGGLWHPNWNQNLKFAIKIQEKAEEMYPGLFKPIMLTKSRYNQHTGKFASIIEVGATGNTLEQCLTSMKYLAKVMNEVIQ